MGFREKYLARTAQRGLLCVGLDPEPEKLPAIIKKAQKPLFEFCRQIADATAEYASAFKPNIAFFESSGAEGIGEFEDLLEYLKTQHPQIPVIADVKRGDLGNTAKEYARYYFDVLEADAITLSPYMGSDSIQPFLQYENSFVFLLCVTSNPGSAELQKKTFADGQTLFEKVADMAETLGNDKTGLVTGATNPEELLGLRKLHPETMFLVPGVGAQGGDPAVILNAGKNTVISVSRSIIYASSDPDFAEKAYLKAGEFASLLQLQ